jgi:anaerobic carbon-monoxide dehydrogenase iron sulfur subunit
MIFCDIQLCVGCRICEVTCSRHHFGAVSPSLSRIRVAKLEDTGIELAVACMSCAEKPCLECPTGALSVAPDGPILLDSNLCNSCMTCRDACPVGAVGFNDGRPLLCDLCGGSVSCVAACPSRALSNPAEFRDLSLAASMPVQGNPAERRARYACEQGTALRIRWKNGERAES